MDEEINSQPEEQSQPEEKSKKKLGLVLKIVGAVILVIALLPLLLYIPGIQRWVTGIAVEQAEQATGYNINVSELHLKFPLRLSLAGVEIIDEKGDTMLVGNKVEVDVRLLPLAMGDLVVRQVELDGAKYYLKSDDASMVMNVVVRSAILDNTKVELLTNRVAVKELSLSGADVVLNMDKRKEVAKSDTASANAPWLIDVKKLRIADTRFRMAMMPAIDSLDLLLPKAEINTAAVNLAVGVVNVGGVCLDSLAASYFYPSADNAAAFLAECMPDTVAPTPSGEDWFIQLDSLRVRNSSAVYALKGATPAEGLDMNHISVSDINIAIDKFYNKGSKIKVPVTGLTAEERCGVGIKSAKGYFEMNDSAMIVKSFDLQTLMSDIRIDADFDSRIFDGREQSRLYADMRSSVSLEEVGKMFPLLRPQLQAVSRTRNADLELFVDGNGKSLDIKKLSLNVPRIIDLKAKGQVSDLSQPKKTGGRVELSGKLTGGDVVGGMADLGDDMRIPVLDLKGKADYRNSRLIADLNAYVDSGQVVMSGDWSMTAKKYAGKLDFAGFDVRSFMPRGTVGIVSGDISVDGMGYDPYTMVASASANISRIDIGGVPYNDIALHCILDNGEYEVAAISPNRYAAMDMIISGNIAGSVYSANIDGSIDNIDLKQLGFSEEPLQGELSISGDVFVDLKNKDYHSNLALSNIDLIIGKNNIKTETIFLDFKSNIDRTEIRLDNNDFNMSFNSPSGLDVWLDSISRVSPSIAENLKLQRFDVGAFKSAIPYFDLKMGVGLNNVVSQYLYGSGFEFGKIAVDAGKTDDLHFDADVFDIKSAGVAIDSVCFTGYTLGDSLLYDLHVGNRSKNATLFKVADLKGCLYGNTLTTYLTQTDRFGEKGFDVGTRLSLADSVVRAELYPANPVIAFKNWTLNEDNYLSFNFVDGSINAKLLASTADGGLINLYSDDPKKANNGINVDLDKIRLRDWLTLSPFAPPIDGTLSSKMKLRYSNKYLWGNGKINVDELTYGKRRVGDFGFDAKLAYINETQKVLAVGAVDIDGRNILKVRGTIADSLQTKYYNMDMTVDRLPLNTANAFLPKSLGYLSGYMNSSFKFKGTLSNPDIAGYINFDSTEVALTGYGAKFRVDTVKIPFDAGNVIFNRFDLFGANGRPITIDGNFRALPTDKMYSDLTIRGRNVQIIDSKKSGTAEVFGKGFANINAKVKGYMNQLDADVNLSVLSGSDITYVLQSDIAELTEASGTDVVQFVEFKDSAKVVRNDTIAEKPFAMKINALLTLQPNAKFSVFLSPDGKDRVIIDGEGSLNYSQSYQGDARMTGWYEISDGYVRYNVPMLGEKKFDFVSGSNVNWTGDLLNPTLNIKAVDKVKANVVTNDNSRMVPFDVSLNIGSTLSKLDIKFDLATSSDMTIANELSGMSPEQRSTQAMNLLLYGSYTGGSTKTASNLSGENMAFSFLESSLNKWAANNISGVQLSFGIDQYDKTTAKGTSSTTNYSYQVSKSLWSDRFTISVGGSYSTDASAQDNLAQNLFNDVSFEYKLNKSGSTYFKLFRKTEYESILEGEITEMGGGLVWKRKIASIRDIFKVFKNNKNGKSRPYDREKVRPDSITNRRNLR